MYINQGYIQGTLAQDPKQVAEGVVLLIVRVRDSRINPKTNQREFHFPTFVVFGKEADKAVEHLEKNQEISLEYKLETRRKEIEGEMRYFEDKVATRVTYGRKKERREAFPTSGAAAPKEDN